MLRASINESEIKKKAKKNLKFHFRQNLLLLRDFSPNAEQKLWKSSRTQPFSFRSEWDSRSARIYRRVDTHKFRISAKHRGLIGFFSRISILEFTMAPPVTSPAAFSLPPPTFYKDIPLVERARRPALTITPETSTLSPYSSLFSIDHGPSN